MAGFVGVIRSRCACNPFDNDNAVAVKDSYPLYPRILADSSWGNNAEPPVIPRG